MAKKEQYICITCSRDELFSATGNIDKSMMRGTKVPLFAHDVHHMMSHRSLGPPSGHMMISA
eukprot:4799487-Amphidinium_carterae.1